MPEISSPRPRTAVDALAERHFDGYCALDPIFAAEAGVAGYEEAMTDFSPDGHAARADLARRTLEELAATPAVDGTDRVTAAALRERLGLALVEHEAKLDLADLNNISSPVQNVREVFDLAPRHHVDDWARIASRLGLVGETLTGYRQGLTAAMDAGWRPAARQIAAVERQAREFSGTGAEAFFPSLAATPTAEDGADLPESLRKDLDTAAHRAAAAYGELADWFAGLGPRTRSDDAVGPELYALCAPAFTGTQLDLAETYAWGVQELARIETRMAEVCRRLLTDARVEIPGGGFRPLIETTQATLDADPARVLHGTDALLTWMQELSDRAVAGLAGTHFDIPEQLRRLACRIAPSSAGGIYYTGPSEDLTRPGQMWWSVTEGQTTFSTWRETSTVYHEGVPGHHLQIGQAVLQADRLNRWRRLGCWTSGHGEGWALYAERLMEELGYLEDPADLLGMLDAQALRAARVIVDIGVHCRLAAPAEVGGGTWDAEKVWTFLGAHTRLPEGQRRFELERYLGWPGQAISYKVGERVWLDLREQLTAGGAGRPGMSLRDFHAEALALGSIGLDVLREALLDR